MTALGSAPGAALAVLLGLIFGSFATAAAWRLPRGEPIGAARSRCTACDTPLTAADLVPLLSWLVSRGRCRHCGTAVHWRYPATEAVTALLFLLVWLQDRPLAETVVLAAVVVALVILTAADLDCFILPDAVQIALIPLALGWRWLTDWDVADMAFGCALGLGLGLALRLGFRALRGRDGLGLGDVKFLGVAGLYLGLSGFAPFLLLAGVLGLGLGLAWRAAGKGMLFPFGPALTTALLSAVLFPEQVRLVAAFGV